MLQMLHSLHPKILAMNFNTAYKSQKSRALMIAVPAISVQDQELPRDAPERCVSPKNF
jgi:hypothetical protein